MKSYLLLAIMLFVYPWNKSNQNAEKLLFEGMYTITGRAYNEFHTYDSAAGCRAVYVKAYETKLIVTMSKYGSPEYVDVEYQYAGTDNQGNRIYRKDYSEAFVVDSDQEMQHITTTFTYNGNKRIDTYGEMVKGDYSADCLKRMEGELQWEHMKSTMDLDGSY